MGHFHNPTDEVVASEHLPSSSTWHCKLADYHQVVISLTAKNQLAFSVTSPAIQTAAIKAVALQHHVSLTSTQLVELAKIPLLRINVESLPYYLQQPVSRRNSPSQLNKMSLLDEKELVECIGKAREFANTSTHGPMRIAVRIDSEAKMSAVNHLTALLEGQGPNRVDLVTQLAQMQR
ncbi:hypothetical protein GCM10022409_43910 [Hymenobacter glaciei]|uniref:Uncharacterized protein n=1 Tax=Hymenobacter glaciei TaxID=877209 RepID=A0ABP7UVN4_9BACT